MKRYMTLVAGLLAAILDATYLVISIRGLSSIIGGLIGGNFIFAIISFATLSIALSGILSNATSISAFKCSHEKYSIKRRSINKAITINVVLSILLIYSMTSSFTALKLIVTLGSFVSSALYIADFYFEKKRVAATSSAKKESQKQTQTD